MLPDSWTTTGLIREQQFVLAALKKGWYVYRAIHPQSLYDYVIDKGEGPERVEVKSACYTKDKGTVCVPTTYNRPYPTGSWEWLAAVDPEGQVWLIPGVIACERSSISISSERYKKYKL